MTRSERDANEALARAPWNSPEWAAMRRQERLGNQGRGPLRYDGSLNPARAIINGVILGIAAWIVVAAIAIYLDVDETAAWMFAWSDVILEWIVELVL